MAVNHALLFINCPYFSKCDQVLWNSLTFTTLWADSEDKLVIFSYFSKKTGFDISCKLSLMETICMKCQILFSGKNMKKYFSMLSAENFTQSG